MQEIPELARLSEDSRWVRALARSLVTDAASADDLAQDAWLAALKQGSVLGPLKRSWLGVVLRRRLFEQRRADAARRERELRAARAEALPSALEMVERAAVQRDIVQAVLDLDEPYRSTVLWRFFEDLPPREIAQRAGVPVATVHTRIGRALERLRTRLDRDHGGKGACLSVLVPFLTERTTPLGAWMMKTSTKIAIAALAVVSGVVVWRVVHPGEPGSAVPGSIALAQPESPDREASRKDTALTSEPTDARRDLATAGVRREETPAATGTQPTSFRLRGLVLDAAGRMLAGVRLATRPAAGEGFQSNADGRFDVQLAREVGSIVSDDPRYATVLPGNGETRADAIVVVAPRVELAGTVVDEQGARLHGVELRIDLPAGFGADFGHALDTALDRRWIVHTDSEGAFVIPDAPAVPGSSLRAELGAFDVHREPLPMSGARNLWIVLRRAGSISTMVQGIVVDPDAKRVAGARVALGKQTVFSDANGRFAVDSAQVPRPMRITAVMKGLRPAIQSFAEGEWPREIVLQLGATTLSLSGRVVDERAEPVPGARVWLSDPTPFGIVDNEPLHAEPLSASDDRRFWAWVETDAEGRFRIDGLLEREYGVTALDTRTLLQAQTRAAAGTDDVLIRLPKDEVFPLVRGRVVTFEGDGVPGISVTAQRPGFEFTYPDGGTRDEYSHRPPVTTGADGSFELRDVPRKGVELFANGDAILFAYAKMDEVRDPLEVRIRARLRRHLHVELAPPIDRADSLRVLDAEGKPLLLRIMRGSASFTNRKADIVEGRSQVLSLSDEARTVVFLKAGVEVGRTDVRLSGSNVETVRW